MPRPAQEGEFLPRAWSCLERVPLEHMERRLSRAANWLPDSIASSDQLQVLLLCCWL